MMIGIFDSGMGGLNALYELRKLKPSIDICFLADKKHAPYGTKNQSELIRLVKNDISALKNHGAECILMACCTASTVYGRLPQKMQDIAVPIIEPTAKEALRFTKSGRIGVIATEATVRSHAFKNALDKLGGATEITELPTGRLVEIIESGIHDGAVSQEKRNEIFSIIKSIKEKNIDTLILGCTHFQKLEREISGMLPEVRTVSSARVGAKEMSKHTGICGHGRTFYLL